MASGREEIVFKNPVSLLFVSIVALVFGSTSASAQFDCRTSNCEVGTAVPAGCQERATPRNINIAMTDGFVFIPSQPRIEGGDSAYQCIEWETTGFEPHSATEDDCDTGFSCDAAQTMPSMCEFETGNVSSLTTFGTCHYASVTPSSYGFHCRFHGIPGQGMAGTLNVVNRIDLRLTKSGLDVQLDWATGGVGPWNVFSDSLPSMPFPTALLSGTNLRAHTDPSPASEVYYLIMEDN